MSEPPRLGETVPVAHKDVRQYYDAEYYRREGADRWETDRFRGYRHLLRPLRLRAGTRLLDVACGRGEVGALCRKQGVEAFGIDLSKVALGVAHRQGDGNPVCAALAERLPFRSASFDLVTCLGSLEHFLDAPAALRSIRRCSRDEAEFIFVVPNRRYIAHWFREMGTDQRRIHETLRSLAQWRALFEDQGFRVETVLADRRPTWWAWIAGGGVLRLRFFLKLAKGILLQCLPLAFQYQFIFHLRKNRQASRIDSMPVAPPSTKHP